MTSTLTLPYGSAPLAMAMDAETVVVEPPPAPAPGRLPALLRAALDRPIGGAGLESAAARGDRVTVIVSDHSRPDPRDALLRAVLERLPPGIHLTLAVATGTHGPDDLARLEVGADLWARADAIVNHDGHDGRELLEVGTTARGTPVRMHRCVVESDLVIATGVIKPHYFAGYGAGVKAIYPGLGDASGVRVNHRLKAAPGAVAGNAEENPCRADLEEAVALLRGRRFLLNVVVDASGGAQAAVAGDPVLAFRAGARACEPLSRVRAPAGRCVVVSDSLPLTGSLYQASKLVAAVAPLVEPGGTVVLAAECPDGVGPVDTVNRAIYELGVRPRLPPEHRVVLVSSLSPAAVAGTYCQWAGSVDAAVAAAGGAPVVLPRAGGLIVERL